MDIAKKIKKYYILTKREEYQVPIPNLHTAFSNVYQFFALHHYKREEIKRHINSVNLSSIGIPEKPFETKDNALFDPSKLDIYCPEKKNNNKGCY